MKNIGIVAIAGLACIATLICSCEKNSPVEPENLTERKDIVLTRAQQEYVREANSFAIRLYGEVAREGGSFIISPLSVTYTLGMINNGARGVTQEEIIEVLGFQDGTARDINEFCKTMMEQSSQIDPSVTLEIANVAFADKGNVPLKETFVKEIESNYEAKVINLDYDTEDVQGIINRWGAEKTHGMIPKILDNPISKDSYAHFLNAIYFKGIWSYRFDKKNTREETFRKEDGSTISVNMMRQRTDFKSGSNAVFQTLCLPYGNQAYRMIVMLPNEGKTLADVAAFLTPESWNETVDGLRTADVDVKLPVFESEFKIQLKEALANLGMPTAFTEFADFSAMAETSLCIGQVLQKAKIKVDEEGSEAAAVTIGEMVTTSIGPIPEIVNFHADHPFLYAITEVSTGAIFFIGRYTGE
ncbi:MAG: serpin family protein [Bacteroidota bacterium]|jgi:serpin B|nr:serpin family protein [Bacteroidota bacterium]